MNVVSTTEQWAGAALAGPKSRDMLAKLFPNLDVQMRDYHLWVMYKEIIWC